MDRVGLASVRDVGDGLAHALPSGDMPVTDSPLVVAPKTDMRFDD